MGSSPKRTVERCRQVIETHPDVLERRSLLAIAQIFLGIRCNEESLPQLLGGHEAMIESPVLDRLLDEFLERGRLEARQERSDRMHARILGSLQDRFGQAPEDSERRILQFTGPEVLEDLLVLAVTAPTLEDFEGKLAMLATEA